MPSKAEQTETTRRALIAAARELFAEEGFAATSTESVVRRAGVTRGALYHHFGDKTDLFAAVYEDIERGLAEDLAARLGPGASPLEDPVALLVLGIDAFLEACLDPAVRRVALLEGPTVLGWRRWHDVQEAYGLGLTKVALQAAMDAGRLRRFPVDTLAHLLLGALMEAAMLVAMADDHAAAMAEVAETLHGLVDALREPAVGA